MREGIHTDLNQLIRQRFIAAKLQLFCDHKTQQQNAGTKAATHLGRGMDFAEVRPYQAGDDVRHINWRLTARAGKPYSKIYQEERERPIYIVVDQSASMQFGTRTLFKSVLAAKLAAVYAWAGLSHNDQVGGMVFNDDKYQWIKPKRQRKTLLQFLTSIATYNRHTTAVNEKNQFEKVLQQLKRNITSGSIVIVISDFMQLNDTAATVLTSMSRYNTILNVLTYDVLEQQAPKNNIFNFGDGEHQFEFDGFAEANIQAYQAMFAQRNSMLTTLCHQNKMRLIKVATNANLRDAVTKVRL